MDLTLISTQELEAELCRRKKEEKTKKQSERDYKFKYAYARAMVTYALSTPFSRGRWNVELLQDEAIKYNRNNQGSFDRTFKDVSLDKTVFKASNAPKLGDIVMLRSRITKHNPNGFGAFAQPIVCEVLKRGEIEK